jgi:hypothetical protein
MSTLTDFLTSIANAIRTKKGTNTPIPAADFASEIASISGGSDPFANVDFYFVPTTWDIYHEKITDGEWKGTSIPSHYFDKWYSFNAPLPSNITSISTYAFRGCSGLTITSLPDGITTIGEYAFMESGVKFTSLPSRLTTISNYLFSSVSSLLLSSLPSGVTSIGNNAFNYCTKISISSLPSGVTSIGNNAFRYCSNITISSLPSGVTSIGTYAFQGCSKITINEIPAGVSELKTSAFNACTGITSMYIKNAQMTDIASNTFTACTNLLNIYVPWSENAVANAPWGAVNATITYNYNGGNS